MEIYLPIAETTTLLTLLFGLGLGVGILSGLFGVGGGFILTPMLFFIGIPPATAVGTQGTLIVASSFSGLLAHLRRKTVDFPMGLLLLVGGLAGSALGVRLFRVLTSLGQIELIVKLAYVLLLGVVGALMFLEALSAIRRRRSGQTVAKRRKHHTWIHRLPLRMRFRASNLYISALPPVGIGIGVGVLSAIMGVGGGFLMVPAMIYLLGMPTRTVIGTSLFQITFMASFTTILHAIENHTVDIVLGTLLIVGGVVGAQIGVRLGTRLAADMLRIALALLVLAISAKVGLELAIEPPDLYSVEATK